MSIDRSIRSMTAEEKQAKRDWGTGACQVRGCTTRAAYLAMETTHGDSETGDWWEYCCPKHGKSFADRHGLELPAVVRTSRAAVARETAGTVRESAS